MTASSDEPEPLAAGTESRIAGFTDLVATSISNTEARAELGRLAEEQAALRRVATLVASEPSPDEVFRSVAEEVVRLLGVENTLVFRYEATGNATLVAVGGETDVGVRVGIEVTLEGESIAARV